MYTTYLPKYRRNIDKKNSKVVKLWDAYFLHKMVIFIETFKFNNPLQLEDQSIGVTLNAKLSTVAQAMTKE